MRFDVIVTGRPVLSLGGLRRQRAGVMIDGQARFGGERVRVSWALARQLIGAGQAEAAPGVVVPLTNPEPRP